MRAVLAEPRAVVLDADAITSFAQARGELLAALHQHCVLTPHEGEFRRLFPGEGDRLGRALQAAAEARAVVLLKGKRHHRGGTRTGVPASCRRPRPSLPPQAAATRWPGSSSACWRQGMPAYEAAAAGAWLHAQTARGAGPGLIAEDLAERLPAVLAALVRG